MPVTARQRQQPFLWFEEQMGQERAATMMELMPPVGAEELATKADLRVLQADMRVDMAELRTEMAVMRADIVRSLGTLIIASQAATITAVGVFTAIS